MIGFIILYVISVCLTLAYCKIMKDSECVALCFIPLMNTAMIAMFLVVLIVVGVGSVFSYLTSPICRWIEK